MTLQGADAAAAAVIGEWYADEVGGEALLWRLAEHARPEATAKWLALASVEARVAERLLHVLLTHELPVPPTAESLEWARTCAEANALRPWHEQMAWLGTIAAEALESTRRDAAGLAPPFAAIGVMVVRHEELLAEFARRELSGDAARSLALVEEFLATTPRP